jgi:hypothetical protein
MALEENDDDSWNPYGIVQHPAITPRKTEMMIPDNRVKNCFNKQLAIDAVTRVVLIGGSLVILIPFLKQETAVS